MVQHFIHSNFVRGALIIAATTEIEKKIVGRNGTTEDSKQIN